MIRPSSSPIAFSRGGARRPTMRSCSSPVIWGRCHEPGAPRAGGRIRPRARELSGRARDVIYTLSLDGKIKSLNPVFETITGWPRAEWIGREFSLIVHPDDLPRAVTFFKTVLDGRVPPTFELRVRTKSGAYVPGEFMATPLMQDAQLVGVLGAARDITDRKRAAEALRHLNAAFEAAITV